MKNIHETPEERLAKNTEGTIDAIHGTSEMVRQTTKAVESLASVIKDKSVSITGFTGVIASLKKNTEALEKLSPTKVVQKLEEIKSATLITNQLLKKIEKHVSREPVPFPKIEIPKTDFSETNDLLKQVLAALAKDQDIKVVMKLK